MISFTTPQRAFLASESKRLGVPIAELVRRFIDKEMGTLAPLTADKPSTDAMTQRYRTALKVLNTAPIGNLTASDLEWMTGQLKRRWHANGRGSDLMLPYDDIAMSTRTVERLEALVKKYRKQSER